MVPNSALRWSIDADDVIQRVEGPWSSFAAENGAPELTPDSVLGRPLWDFIEGIEARYLYRVLVDRVRAGAGPARVSFRCDGPALRRHMELAIRHAGAGTVEFESQLEHSEARPPAEALAREAARSDAVVPICSYCKRVRTAESTWIEIEEATGSLLVLASAPYPRFSHGACPACVGRLREYLAESSDDHGGDDEPPASRRRSPS